MTVDDPSRTADRSSRILAETTTQAYRRDWFDFARWCRQHAGDPAALPIDPVLAAAYLASLAGAVGASALNRRVAAIAYEHRRRGLVWTAGHPAIRNVLRDIRRRHGRPVSSAAVLTLADIKQLLATCREDVVGSRDRALFLVSFAAGLRRSELVAIDHAHLRFEADHAEIGLPRATINLPREREWAGGVGETCPVQALERWLARANIRRGAVFRSVTSRGRLGDRLSADGVRHILSSRAKLADLTMGPTERLSPHGLRAGVVRLQRGE